MGYDSTTKKLSIPIGFGDIGTALGTSSLDLGTLCTHANINMWARRKPIRYNSTAALTDSQLAGTDAEKTAGYYYGVHLANTGAIYALHDFTIDYHKPRGASYSEWYRAYDFNGYVHNASPNIKVSMPTSAYSDLEYDYEIGIALLAVESGETPGIDYEEVIESVFGRSDALDYAYPCLLLGNKYCALRNKAQGKVTPMRYNSVLQTQFLADISASGITDETAKATVFLANYTGYDVDITGAWNTLTTTQTFSKQSIPLYGGIGNTITLTDYYAKPPTMYISNVSSSSLEIVVTYAVSRGTATETYRTDVTLVVNGKSSTNSITTMAVNGNVVTGGGIMRFSAASFDATWTAGTVVSYSATIQCVYPSSGLTTAGIGLADSVTIAA